METNPFGKLTLPGQSRALPEDAQRDVAEGYAAAEKDLLSGQDASGRGSPDHFPRYGRTSVKLQTISCPTGEGDEERDVSCEVLVAVWSATRLPGSLSRALVGGRAG